MARRLGRVGFPLLLGVLPGQFQEDLARLLEQLGLPGGDEHVNPRRLAR